MTQIASLQSNLHTAKLQMDCSFSKELELVDQALLSSILQGDETQIWTSRRFYVTNGIRLPASYIAELSIALKVGGYTIEHLSNEYSYERVQISGWSKL